MKNINKLQHFIFVVLILGLIFVQSYSAEAVSSTGESNAFSVYTINSLADINRGLSLYGDGDYVHIPNTPDINLGTHDKRTVEVWFKVRDKTISTKKQVIYEEGGTTRGLNIYLFDSLLYVSEYNENMSSWSGTYLSTDAIESEKWHHVALVLDGTDTLQSNALKAYLDGNSFGSGNGLRLVEHLNPIGIGAANGKTRFEDETFEGGEGHFFDGLIDEVRIWNIARPQEHIRATMNEKLQGNEPDLVAYFSFNDGTGYDSSQHSGNHGRLQGDAEIVTLHGPWPQPKIGDVSGNDEITAHDAALILQYVVGLISEFPADSMVSPSAIEPRDYEISLPNVETSAGGRIQVPIAINDATGLLAGGITVKYDQTVLRATDVLCGGILSRSYWRKNTDLDGEVRFAFASGESPTESGRMLVIEFDVLPHAEGKTSPLILEDVNLSNSRSIMKIDGEVRVIPSTFALLQNFPNPFNPDTWLPYQLASASPVSISIYNAKGQLIRTLNLGYQNAGAYVTKGKAAYWDGKDNAGENVASGVYFYTLRIERQRNPDEERVEEFRYTRKMAIMK